MTDVPEQMPVSEGPPDGMSTDQNADPPPPPPEEYVPVEPAAKRSKVTAVLAVTTAILLVTTVAFAALWRSANEEKNDLQAEKAALVAAENARPDLKAIADRYFSGSTVTFSGGADSLEVTERYSSTINDNALGKFLAELGFSSAVIERMGRTRALDGTQTAEGRNVNVSWTYHPDDGLQMVFEVER